MSWLSGYGMTKEKLVYNQISVNNFWTKLVMRFSLKNAGKLFSASLSYH